MLVTQKMLIKEKMECDDNYSTESQNELKIGLMTTTTMYLSCIQSQLLLSFIISHSVLITIGTS